MGQTSQNDYPLSAFPTVSRDFVVAPFAADIDISTTGNVIYSESFSQLSMNDVSEHIRVGTGTSFNGTWMLAAEWNRVPLYLRSSVSACIQIKIIRIVP